MNTVLVNTVLVVAVLLLQISAQTFTYTDPSGGELYSPNFFSNYSNNLNVIYDISMPPGYYIRLTFYVFHTEPGNDVLDVYDGPLVDPNTLKVELSGDKSATVVTSTGNSLLLHFITDLDVTFMGFYARYDTVLVGTSPSPVPGCVGSFYSTSLFQAITSPNWPRNYTNNLDCHYYLEVDDGSRVHLLIDSFDTERDDILNIYDGPNANSKLLATLYGSRSAPVVLESSGPTLYLLFSSDLIDTSSGFSAVFWPISPVGAPRPNVANIFKEKSAKFRSAKQMQISA